MIDKFVIKYLNSKNIVFYLVMILFLLFIINSKDIAIMFFASYVIACSINPIVDKMEEKMPRTLATILVTLGILVVVLTIFIPVCELSYEQIKVFADKLPEYIDNLDEYIFSLPLLKHFSFLAGDANNLMAKVSLSSEDMLQRMMDIGKNIGSAFIYIFVSLIIIFNMVADKAVIKEFYLKMFPKNKRKRAKEVGKIISDKMGGYLIALVATSFSVGIVMLFGLWILKVPYAALLAVITAVFDIIPVIGPALALIVCVIATYEAGMGAVISLIAVFATAQLVENNLVRPYVFGKFLQIHPLIVFLFLFIAAQYIGFVGVIFAPAIAALVAVLFEELYLKKIQ